MIAAPHDVYGQPANLHVARFMGYRNVLEMKVEAEQGDRVTLSGPDMRLTGVRKQPIGGGRACVAMRPEEFVLGTDDRWPPTPLLAGSPTSNTAAAIRWSMSSRLPARCCTFALPARRASATPSTCMCRSSACSSIPRE